MDIVRLSAVGPVSDVAKATLLLAIGWVVTRMLRRAPAVARHAVWLVVLAGVLIVPVVARLLPVTATILPGTQRADLAVLLTPGQQASDGVTSPSNSEGVSGASRQVIGARSVDAAIPDFHQTDPWFDYRTAVVAIWISVAAAFVAWLVAGMRAVRRIVREGRPMESGPWVDAVSDAAERLGIAAAPGLVVSDRVAMAFVCGVVKPTIVLPPEAITWEDGRRRAVVLHGMAHLRRRDLIWHTVARLTCAVYWFHPLAWLAARRLRIESELACDDLVLASGTRASDYAQHLLDMVADLGRYRGAPAGALPMIRRSEIEVRLLAVLDRATGRPAMSRARIGALVGTMGLLTVSIAAVTPVQGTDALSTPTFAELAIPADASLLASSTPGVARPPRVGGQASGARHPIARQAVAPANTSEPEVVASRPATATIAGRVMNARTGAPIPHVLIYIPKTSYSDSTSDSGTYALKNVPYGLFNIEARKAGYTDVHLINTRVDQTTFILDITMESMATPPVPLRDTAGGRPSQLQAGRDSFHLSISDLILVRTTATSPLPRNMQEALAHRYAKDEVVDGAHVALYWEVYGEKEGDTVDASLWVSKVRPDTVPGPYRSPLTLDFGAGHPDGIGIDRSAGPSIEVTWCEPHKWDLPVIAQLRRDDPPTCYANGSNPSGRRERRC